MMEHEATKTHNENYDFIKLQYQILSDKQLNHNSLLWSIPSLLFVAQTFLWNISLDDEMHFAVRCCASLFSILIGFASVQSFIRNRLMEIADCEQLYAIEKFMAENNCAPVLAVHHQLNKRTTICNGRYYKLADILQNKNFYKTHSLSHLRTYFVWECVIWITLLLSVILFVYNLISAINQYFNIDVINQLIFLINRFDTLSSNHLSVQNN